MTEEDDWTAADYVILGETWAYKSTLTGVETWLVGGLFGADRNELTRWAGEKGITIVPARLVPVVVKP